MPKRQNSSILIGRLFDETGEAMTTNHAVKQGKRYRYYISRCLNGMQPNSHTGWRLPADEIESVISDAMRAFLVDPIHVMEAFRSTGFNDEDAVKLSTSLTRQSLSEKDLKQIVQRAAQRIDISRDNIRIAIDLGELSDHQHLDRHPGPGDSDRSASTYELTLSTRLRRRGVETKIVLAGASQATGSVDSQLIELVAKAHYWFDLLKRGEVQSIAEIAAREEICAGDVSRFLPLAFLSPQIITTILEGHQPVEMTAETLKRMPTLPLDWDDQHSALGFESRARRP